ncbi:MAG: alpha/beta fold hydrolase [Polyangiaceae bacterium]|nr:alpha/beta fold hydrolase [Polyangiaceae bacterium]
MSVERIERVDGRLHVRVVAPDAHQRRAAVVLVHGICLSGQVWRNWAPALAARGIEAWCPDLRAHGDSAGRDELKRTSMDDYAADIEAVLDAAGSQAVVGHDLGGLVAQMIAARRPLRGIALLGSFSSRNVSGTRSITQLWRNLRPRYLEAMFRGKPWQPTPDDMAVLALGRLDDAMRAEVTSWMCPESGLAAREVGVAGVPVDEAAIRCPVLVAAMTQDRFTPPPRQRLISQRYRADYVEFAQHAHFPMLEDGWERPAAVVGRWLEEAARLGEERTKGSMTRLAALQGRDPTGTPTASPRPPVTSAPDLTDGSERKA